MFWLLVAIFLGRIFVKKSIWRIKRVGLFWSFIFIFKFLQLKASSDFWKVAVESLWEVGPIEIVCAHTISMVEPVAWFEFGTDSVESLEIYEWV